MLRFSGVRTRRLGGLEVLVRDTRLPGLPDRCVALVHGLGDSSLTWRRLLWDEKGWKVPYGTLLAAPDMPGTEGSAPPAAPEDYSIRSVLEPMCPRWTVVGNSLGGWTAAWLALQWPEGVERLVLLSPAGMDDPTGTSARSAAELAEPTEAIAQAFYRKARHAAPPLPRAIWPEMVRRLRERPSKLIVDAIKKEHLLDGRLKALKMPAAVLWGASDGVIPPSQAARFGAGLPQAAVTTVPACGHLEQLECPGPVRAAVFASGPIQ